ncbi:hypothetical protein [Streptomyces subrutilus]|uniref:Uncharacterized protein n=1 Tax=Streptomyces subrutilus TaxID=36818 RepID=A0A1E5PLM4_9ACTN|nr:hypothetical protein [Streptomyces subrutilus]OEJ30353.1 hypothetical protein BGK67_02375 [Streptomyces subrutilus]
MVTRQPGPGCRQLGSAAYRPISGATEHTCSVDPVYRRMIVRYHTSAGKRIAGYPLSAFETRGFGSPLVDFKQPTIPGTAQGYTLCDSYMYFATGVEGDRRSSISYKNVLVRAKPPGRPPAGAVTRCGGGFVKRRVPVPRGAERNEYGLDETGRPQPTTRR